MVRWTEKRIKNMENYKNSSLTITGNDAVAAAKEFNLKIMRFCNSPPPLYHHPPPPLTSPTRGLSSERSQVSERDEYLAYKYFTLEHPDDINSWDSAGHRNAVHPG